MTQPYGPPPGGAKPRSDDAPEPTQPRTDYAQQVYSAAPMPSAPPEHLGAHVRPGTVTAAVVLAFVQAGITGMTTIMGVAGAADAAAGGEAAVGWLLMVAQAVGMALLIIGGVQLLQGRGRTILLAGVALELLVCALYLVVFALVPTYGLGLAEGAKAFLVISALFFAVMPILSLIMSLGSAATEWLRDRS